MSTVVLGAGGQLGRALRQYLPQATFLARNQLDICDAEAVRAFDWRSVTMLINAGAYTKVDEAETDLGRKQAYAANCTGLGNLTQIAIRNGMVLVHISTDYVFNGKSNHPYKETDPVSPQGVYGRSKLAGESVVEELEKHLVVRTSAVYYEGGRNFVAAILAKALKGEPLRVVDYQVVRPTYAGDLARAIVKLGRDRAAPFGIYHCQNSGNPTTWFDYAKKILEMTGLKCAIEPLSRTQFQQLYPSAAPRPDYSVLNLAKLEYYGIQMPDWQDTLAEALPRLRQAIEAKA